jgi:hypothetical protein
MSVLGLKRSFASGRYRPKADTFERPKAGGHRQAISKLAARVLRLANVPTESGTNYFVPPLAISYDEQTSYLEYLP